MPNLLIHIMNEDPVLCEVDTMPNATDTCVIVKNPRRKDGKDLHYLEANVSTVIWPMSRINYIEVIPTGEDEEIISFVRE
jgi:hypothetical protein